MFRSLAVVALVLFPASLALAQGFVVPPAGAALETFTLETQQISITVEDGIASYEVNQEFRNNTGEPIEAAVRASQAIAALRSIQRIDVNAPTRFVGDKLFRCVDGVWVDGDVVAGMAIETVSFGSEAYFDLLWSEPDLWGAAALGQRVIVATDDGRALAFAPAA